MCSVPRHKDSASQLSVCKGFWFLYFKHPNSVLVAATEWPRCQFLLRYTMPKNPTLTMDPPPGTQGASRRTTTLVFEFPRENLPEDWRIGSEIYFHPEKSGFLYFRPPKKTFFGVLFIVELWWWCWKRFPACLANIRLGAGATNRHSWMSWSFGKSNQTIFRLWSPSH